MTEPSASPASAVYRLRIELRDTDPPVWRRVELAGSQNLAEVSRVFQLAMGWTDVHQHEFTIGDALYGDADADGAEEAHEMFRESAVTLTDVATAGDKWRYMYDFGDAWDHDVIVEGEFAPEAGATYPRCVDGAQACPPEDVLGPFGYQDFLVSLADPGHPDHAASTQFAPGFDPAAFDLAAVNEALAAPPAPVEPDPQPDLEGEPAPSRRFGRHRRA